VVSIPSWWRSLEIAVHWQWVDGDGNVAKEKHEPPYYVQIPGSVKEIKEKLRYEVRKEPQIDQEATKSLGIEHLEIGRPARIILEGGRLWRSTVVTMGHQQAANIEVLPDMRGIIAEFKCVMPPPGWLGTEFSQKAPQFQRITVWTSEGRTAIPFTVDLRPFTSRNKNHVDGSGDKKIEGIPCYFEEALGRAGAVSPNRAALPGPGWDPSRDSGGG
jgi:hypothetical protein